MREILEQLLSTLAEPNPDRAELLWAEYRAGADSKDPKIKAAADAAFATLLAWYGQVLYRRIWGFVRSDAAEDVLQDVLTRLHRERLSPKLTHFIRGVLPWLRTVAVRECIDAHRREVRRKAREARAACSEGASPDDQHRELQEQLAVAISKLTVPQQQAIALHYFEGLDKQDAAVVMGINRDTLAKRLEEALGRLEKLVPLPAVLAAGGTLGLSTALSARAPVLPVNRLSELVRGAWGKAASSVGWVPKTILVAASVILTGGLAGGWALSNREETPQPPPEPVVEPLQAAKPQPTGEPVPETLQAKNKRLFLTEVLPRLRPALQSLASGEGGTFEVSEKDVLAYDTRIEWSATVRHGKPHAFTTRLRIVHETRTTATRFLLDLFSRGTWRSINPKQPIY